MVRKEVDSGGTIWHYNELRQLHRDGDLPAVIYRDGTIVYYKNGQTHRLGGPAWIWPDRTVQYWIYDYMYTKEQFEAHPLVREYRLKKVMEGLLNDH